MSCTRRWRLMAMAVSVTASHGCGDLTAQKPPPCEGCGAQDAPSTLAWHARIAPNGEPGQPLIIEGLVRTRGGAPAGGVLLYAYHTNANGVYPRRGDETGSARRHGYLRGWVRTDPSGRYRFATIKPEPYPVRFPGIGAPAHVHVTVTPPGQSEYHIDAVHFEGDRHLTSAMRARLQNNGGSGIVRLLRAGDTLHAVRHITLNQD